MLFIPYNLIYIKTITMVGSSKTSFTSLIILQRVNEGRVTECLNNEMKQGDRLTVITSWLRKILLYQPMVMNNFSFSSLIMHQAVNRCHRGCDSDSISVLKYLKNIHLKALVTQCTIPRLLCSVHQSPNIIQGTLLINQISDNLLLF